MENPIEFPLIDNAKVMSKGQVTIPRDIRQRLRIAEGDRVTFICEGDYAIVMNANLYAMKTLQKEMREAFDKAGINNEDDIMQLVKDVREEIEGL